jgi:hypothetical protein
MGIPGSVVAVETVLTADNLLLDVAAEEAHHLLGGTLVIQAEVVVGVFEDDQSLLSEMSWTDRYDGGKMGQWQRLSTEFQAPEETVHCWVALEKGSDAAAEIDAYLADVRIEPIARLSVLERYRLRTRRAQWRNAAVLSWAPAAAEPPKASLKVDGDTWVFPVEGRAVLLNWSNGNAEVRR